MAHEIKTFEGKRFIRRSETHKKRIAKKIGNEYRKKGYNVRIRLGFKRGNKKYYDTWVSESKRK